MKEFKGTSDLKVIRVGGIPIGVGTKDEVSRITCNSLLPDSDEDWEKEKEVTEADMRLYAASPDLLKAAMDFVNKVDTGKARSTDSYNKFKAAINKALGE